MFVIIFTIFAAIDTELTGLHLHDENRPRFKFISYETQYF